MCLKMLCTPLYPMVFMILIPFLNGYFIGKINPTFSDKPRWFTYFHSMVIFYSELLLYQRLTFFKISAGYHPVMGLMETKPIQPLFKPSTSRSNKKSLRLRLFMSSLESWKFSISFRLWHLAVACFLFVKVIPSGFSS